MQNSRRLTFLAQGSEILSPPADFVPAKSGNNDSLAFRIQFGARSFLLTGDMEKPMEGILLAENANLHSDVLKVGHHGSKTSTIAAFLDSVGPSIALISDGFENSFGHPHKDVLARLRDRHTAVLRTDLDGLITVRTDGAAPFDGHLAVVKPSGGRKRPSCGTLCKSLITNRDSVFPATGLHLANIRVE